MRLLDDGVLKARGGPILSKLQGYKADSLIPGLLVCVLPGNYQATAMQLPDRLQAGTKLSPIGLQEDPRNVVASHNVC